MMRSLTSRFPNECISGVHVFRCPCFTDLRQQCKVCFAQGGGCGVQQKGFLNHKQLQGVEAKYSCKRSCTVQLGQDFPNSVKHSLATNQACCTIGNAKSALHRMENMECSEEHFWCVNSCEVLWQHFSCERGCSVEPGRPGRPQLCG